MSKSSVARISQQNPATNNGRLQARPAKAGDCENLVSILYGKSVSTTISFNMLDARTFTLNVARMPVSN